MSDRKTKRERNRKAYAEWPSSVDYSKRLLSIITDKPPFIIEAAKDKTTSMLEWFHILLSRFQDRQFRMVVKAKTGKDLPPSEDFVKTPEATGVHRYEGYLKHEREYWIARQVELITKLTDRHREECFKIMKEHADDPAEVQRLLQKRLGMSQKRAKLIADDQVRKGAEVLNRARYQAMGALNYRWISKQDDRVRSTHEARHGMIFSFHGATHPGWEINCRCVAEPIFPEDLVPPIIESD